jgi:predicted DCC family thiol-disulfide oxidoreductase YuxK
MKPKILYDGNCELCKSSIKFVAEHGGKSKFEFVQLQSEEGKKLLKKSGYSEDYDNSVLLIDNNKHHSESDAVFEILHKIDKPWARFYSLKKIPLPIRNFFYKIVSKFRHKKIVQKIMKQKAGN